MGEALHEGPYSSTDRRLVDRRPSLLECSAWAAPQFFVVSVGTLGLAGDHAPGWRRLREDGLARFDLDALVAMLPR